MASWRLHLKLMFWGDRMANLVTNPQNDNNNNSNNCMSGTTDRLWLCSKAWLQFPRVPQAVIFPHGKQHVTSSVHVCMRAHACVCVLKKKNPLVLHLDHCNKQFHLHLAAAGTEWSEQFPLAPSGVCSILGGCAVERCCRCHGGKKKSRQKKLFCKDCVTWPTCNPCSIQTS